MTPTVSIIILNCSGLQDTLACIRSLLDDGEDDKEIILWDNGSRGDDAAQIERAFPDQVRIFRSPTNEGFAAGNNRAAWHARGTFVVFLNNDTEVTKGWLPPLIAALKADPLLAACQPKIRSLPRPELFDVAGGAGGYIDRFGYPYVRGRVISHQEEDRGQYDSPTAIDWACGACMAVRTKEFLSSGGFDEDFFAYLEEADLCWRWRREGRRLTLVPESTIRHRGGSTWKNRRATMLFYKHRNGLLLLLKQLSFAQLFYVLPVRLVLEMLAVVFYARYGSVTQAFAPIRAIAAAVFHAPKTLKKRMRLPYLPLPKTAVVYEYFIRGRKTYGEMVRD